MDSRQYIAQSSTHDIALPPTSAPPQPSGPSKKRRSSNTCSRGVANLTPDQLSKKRANDREAQRAIRERTKNQIEGLERKIQDLTTQKPYQELQHVAQEKELIEAENEEIKRRLASVLNIIQPLVGTNALAQTLQQQCREPVSQNSGYSPTNSVNTRQAQLGSAPLTSYNGPTSLESSTSTSSTYAPSPHLTKQTPPVLSPAQFNSPTDNLSPINAFDMRSVNVQQPIQPRSADAKLDLGYPCRDRQDRDARQSFGRSSQSSFSASPPLPMVTLSPFQQPHGPDSHANITSPYAVPPRNISPTCPLDGLLLDFLADRRQQAAAGVSTHELIGPKYPSFVSLVNSQRSLLSHPLSRVFTDMMGTFPDIATLPEQVAILHVMFLVMRWQICPNQETYECLPEWVTPRAPQLFIPHPAWIEHIPWPRMRDKMVRIHPSVPLDDFFIPYTTTVSVNWPYDPNDVLLSTPGTEELSINPLFEKHMRDLNNWSLGPAFAKAHPYLEETCRIKHPMEGRRP